MKKSHHQQAVIMRRQGWSYNIIASKLQISKSTLSSWLSTIPFIPNSTVRKRIRNGPAKSAEKRKREKIIRIIKAWKLADLELGNFTKRDLWMLGIGLYLGEGSKKFEEVHVANSDVRIIRLMIAWLVKICNVPKENIQLRIFGYPDTNEEKALSYWRKATNLKRKAFMKMQVDRRKNKRAKKWSALPYGTLHVIVRSRGKVEFGKALHHKIMGWIEATHLKAGVV